MSLLTNTIMLFHSWSMLISANGIAETVINNNS
jgi:hypothetical protein